MSRKGRLTGALLVAPALGRPHAGLLRSTVLRRTLGVVLLLTGIAAGVIAVVGWQANAVLTQATEAAIEADLIELRSELDRNGFAALQTAVADRSRAYGSGLYYLTDRSGAPLAGNLTSLPALFGTGHRRGVFRYPDPISNGGVPVLRSAVGVLVDINGAPGLLVGRDVEQQRGLLYAIYRSIAVGSALLALTGLVGSLFLARHILARIEAMSQASAGIMSGNLSGRIPIDGSNDELDRLAGHLNDMLVRIEQLMAGLREVSDNIAHDLRTPLNRLRNRAEQALADGRGGPAWHDGLERVIDEADELIKTFNALLLIARLEAGSLADSFEPLDLAELVHDVAELYAPAAEEAGLRLEASASPPLGVLGNRQLIGQALANLIDNAIKYARRSGPERAPASGPDIAFEGHILGQNVVLTVADRGPGIPAADRERALRRFVRLEESRSLPGTGLGLSLVAAVARLHGGSVRLEDNAPGLRIVLAIPLAPGSRAVASSAGRARAESGAQS